MKTIAETACRSLSDMIIEAREIQHLDPSRIIHLEKGFWTRADKIERRFRCAGLTESLVAAFLLKRKQFLADESLRHDEQRTDRRTYLHR